MPVSIVVLYHSGFGHTARVAEHVAMGASEATPGNSVHALSVDRLDENGWRLLDEADAIIFGSPTYMGSVSAPFKAFMDSASRRWLKQVWRDKIAAGFTNSGAYDGDRLSTLIQLAVFAMQHSMIWVGTGMMPSVEPDTGEHGINRFGSFMGVMTHSTNAAPEVTPPRCDLETARLFGARVAQIAARFKADA